MSLRKTILLYYFLLFGFFPSYSVVWAEDISFTPTVKKIYWVGDSKSSVTQAYKKSLWFKTVTVPTAAYDETRMCDGDVLCQQLHKFLPGFPYRDSTNMSLIGSHIGDGNYINQYIPLQTGSSLLGDLPKFRDGDKQIQMVIDDLQKTNIDSSREAIVIFDGLGTSNLSSLSVEVTNSVWENVKNLPDGDAQKMQEKMVELQKYTAEKYKEYIEKIHDKAHVTKFIIREFPALEYAPSYKNVKAQNPLLKDAINNFANDANKAISEQIETLNSQNLHVVIVPVYKNMVEKVQNPENYGFFKNTDAYVHAIYKGLKYDEYTHQTACADRLICDVRYLTAFFDDAHPTSALNELFALEEAITYVGDPEIFQMMYQAAEEERLKALSTLERKKESLLELRRKKYLQFQQQNKKAYAWIDEASKMKLQFSHQFQPIREENIDTEILGFTYNLANHVLLGSAFTLDSHSQDQNMHFFGNMQYRGVSITPSLQVQAETNNGSASFENSSHQYTFDIRKPIKVDNRFEIHPHIAIDYISGSSFIFDQSNVTVGVDVFYDHSLSWGHLSLHGSVNYKEPLGQETYQITETFYNIGGEGHINARLSDHSRWHGFLALDLDSFDEYQLSLQYDAEFEPISNTLDQRVTGYFKVEF